VEDHGDFVLGPVSPKEYKDTVTELNGSQTNSVFEFFKVTAPERLGFAKHHEAAERKAAALATIETDAGETATSPRAGGALSKKATNKTALTAAATAAAEGKAWKKRGARPTSSPTTAKRTRVVYVETGAVGTVIAVVSLRSAASSGGGGGDVGGPLLVPLSPKEKDSEEESDVRIVSSVGEASHGRSPPALGHEVPYDEGKSSSASISSSSSSSEHTGQSATGAKKKMILVPKPKRKRTPRAATIVSRRRNQKLLLPIFRSLPKRS
jgi:hypothetical protein